jgi:hypothetical protein
MAIKFNRSQTFATNGTVTAAGLHNLIDGTDIYQALITDQTAMTSVGSLDKLLIADSDLTAADAPRSVTVNELFEDALTLSTYTNVSATNLNYTSATGNYTRSTGATITNGTIANLTAGTTTSTAATITTGTIPTLTAGTTTSTAANITNGTVQTLTASTANISQGSAILTQGTIATLNSTTGTIANLSATTSTFLGTITGSTNLINIGSGQISKDASGNIFLAGGNVSITRASADYNVIALVNTSGVEVQLNANGNTEGNLRTVTNHPLSFTTNNIERLRIDSSGGVTIAGLAGAGSRAVNASAAGLLSAASDASLKEEVVGAHIAGLNEILQIHPKMYRWKDDIANRGENASVELGFIANDVAPIIPSAAPLGNDGLYGFYDRSITAALVKSVQELKSENDSLKSRIEALEAK